MSDVQSIKLTDQLTSTLARFGLTGRRIVIGVPLIWLCVFFLLPFLIVLKISFATQIISIPPFTPLLDWSGGGLVPGLQIDWS
ncbi:MAG: hypothetical protein WA943_02365, partial [Parvibaculum sp.]